VGGGGGGVVLGEVWLLLGVVCGGGWVGCRGRGGVGVWGGVWGGKSVVVASGALEWVWRVGWERGVVGVGVGGGVVGGGGGRGGGVRRGGGVGAGWEVWVGGGGARPYKRSGDIQRRKKQGVGGPDQIELRCTV